MKCEKCGSENVEVISSYIETNERPGYLIFFFLQFINALIIIAGIVLISQATTASPHEAEILILGIPKLSFGIILLCFGSYNFILVFLIGCFRPYRHVTYLVCICKDCGKIEILKKLTAIYYDEDTPQKLIKK